MRGSVGRIVTVLGALLVSSGCGFGDLGSGKTVEVSLDEYHVSVSDTVVPAGKVTFQVRNSGREKHEFVLLKTDIQPTALPENSEQKVDEEASGVKHVDELDGVDAGRTRSLTSQLQAGNYVLICNVPGHVAQGMFARFTVK
jgi:uncharacterized cupredoxin-like copper-binding protein